ncbi:MAG: hypothetical protein LBI69_04715 [Puniceicoccales bacterium]|nr:hypothetical protein [Puniceicoccales bacterium]
METSGKAQKAISNDALGKVRGGNKCVNICTLVVILISVVTCPTLAAVGVLPALPALITLVGCAVIGFGVMIFVGGIFRRGDDSNQGQPLPVVKENQNENPKGRISQQEGILQMVHGAGKPSNTNLSQIEALSIEEKMKKIEAFSLDELIQRIPTEDNLFNDTYGKKFGGYIFNPTNILIGSDDNALASLCEKHNNEVREFLVACELVKITQLKEGGKGMVEAIKSVHWENALCADVKRLNVATHAVMQAIGGGDFLEGRRGLFERIMPLYRAFLDATSQFAIHNPDYLLAISRDVFEKNSWKVERENEVRKASKDAEMKENYGNFIKTIANKNSHNVRMCVACGYDVREIVALNKSWFKNDARIICQGCTENEWLVSNIGGKCNFFSTLWDEMQGQLSSWIDPFGICIRFHESIGGYVKSAVGGTGIDIIDRCRGMLMSIDYENLHDNDDRMKKDTALLKEKSRYIAMLPQVCMAADGTEFLYGACGGMSLEGKGNLSKKYREMCLNVLLPQYEMLAEIAKLTWQREEQGRPVVLNLFQLGMGVYKNDPSILGDFLNKVLEVLDGTGVIVVLHAYSGPDRQRWENAFEATGISDVPIAICKAE